MFTRHWETSERKFEVISHPDTKIPVRDGTKLNCLVYRPDSDAKFPAILGVCAYSLDDQVAPVMPIGTGGIRGHMEAGDPNFYVRRGYVHVIMNVRGTGKSEGFWQFQEALEIQDIYDAIEWIAIQPWCDGNVGMFGVSYFSMVQKRVAALNPPHLKCIYAMYGLTDYYRDWDNHGGILHWNFRTRWIRKIDNLRIEGNRLKKHLGEKEYQRRIERALQDPEIRALPDIRALLQDPDTGRNSLMIEEVLNPLCDDFYQKWNETDLAASRVPAYLGGDWGLYGLHLPGDLRSWEVWQAPKKMTIGPPLYLDRPLYQYDYESLRWFDHWLKGNDTGIMDEPPVRIFVDGKGEWLESSEWPLPETRWVPFYLHENGLLSEHEFWPNEGFTTFVDSPYERGSVSFYTPSIVETTEICGPMVLNLHASSTDTDVLWFVSILVASPEGEKKLLTRGWLRGSQRELDPEKTRPWQPYHTHTKRQMLTPNKIYEFNVEIRPYAIRLEPGYRLVLKIECCDGDPPSHHLHGIGSGHLARQSSSRVSIHHNADYPSHLFVPIVSGNLIGTFISGGLVTN